MKRTFFLLMTVLAGSFHSSVEAQKAAVKTNILSGVLLNVNAGIEMGLSPRWTFDFSADYNGWTLVPGSGPGPPEEAPRGLPPGPAGRSP